MPIFTERIGGVLQARQFAWAGKIEGCVAILKSLGKSPACPLSHRCGVGCATYDVVINICGGSRWEEQESVLLDWGAARGWIARQLCKLVIRNRWNTQITQPGLRLEKVHERLVDSTYIGNP